MPPYMAGGSPWAAYRMPIGGYAPGAPDTGTIWRPNRVEDVSAAKRGDDIFLSDVVSFEVKVFWSTGAASAPGEALPAPAANVDWPFAILPLSPRNPNMSNPSRRFDTWSQLATVGFNWDDANAWSAANANGTQVPLRVRVQTLQIRIRVWDFNTQQTRQLTFVQDI